MKHVLALVLALLFCLSLCACSTGHVNENETIEKDQEEYDEEFSDTGHVAKNENETIKENLKKYGEEFADYDNPAQEIAWSLAQVLADELYRNDIELNPSEFDHDKWNVDTEISEFGEDLEMCILCCRPKNILSGEFWGAAWIRVAWSSNTQELRNIYIMSNIAEMDNDDLIKLVFDNSTLLDIGEVYDELNSESIVEIPQYSIRYIDNIIYYEIPDLDSAVFCNIDFLPHAVYVEDDELYYSNGQCVEIDYDWVYNMGL